MRRWILYAIAALVVIVVAAAGAGALLPVGHRASRTVVFTRSPAVVFSVISDFERHREWRTGVRAVTVHGAGKGATVREEGDDGTITFMVEAIDAPSLLRMRIADRSLPFGGTWTYTLREIATGSELTIVEDGEVYNPIFRLMSRFVFGHHATIDRYIADLQRRLTSL